MTGFPRTTIDRQANCTAILPRGGLSFDNFHQAFDSASGDVLALTAQLVPNLSGTIAATTFIVNAPDFHAVRCVLARPV
jgi:hypothetical protein